MAAMSETATSSRAAWLDLPPALPGRRVAVRDRVIRLLIALAALFAAGVAPYPETIGLDARRLPTVPGVDLSSLLPLANPLTVTVGGHAVYAPWRTSAAEVRASPAMWRRMHVADWHAVPHPIRHEGIDAMLAHYRHLLMRPSTWDRMTTADWDAVPQPVRVVAFRQMLAYWAGYYRLGAEYDLSPRLTADMLCAVVMSESWFDHRAGYAHADGTRDVGLGQASAFARHRLRQLHARGTVDLGLQDEDYLNPWMATRFVALWMRLVLDEAEGDLDLAVRAYHRGIARAHDAYGTVYLGMVHYRLNRYIRNIGAPPAWDYIWRRARVIEAEEWPWMFHHP